jgi:hypothetical protein
MRRQRRFVVALTHQKAPEFSEALFRGTTFVLGCASRTRGSDAAYASRAGYRRSVTGGVR